MKKIVMLVSAALGLALLALPVVRAAADHVQVVTQPGVVYTAPAVAQVPGSVTVVQAPSSVTQVPGSVTVVPAPSTVVIPAPVQQIFIIAEHIYVRDLGRR